MRLKNLLVAIAAVCCAALIAFGAKQILAHTAEINVQAERIEVMKQILPDSTTLERQEYTGDDTVIKEVYKADTGYVIETSYEGYADDVVVWVAVRNDGTVSGLTIRDIHETCGLGGNAAFDAGYLGQFTDKTGELTVGEEIDTLCGATVTSKAITKCVNSAVAYVTGADIDSSATEWGG